MAETADYDTLAATTSIEDMTDNEDNQWTLRSLKNDDLRTLWLCEPGVGDDHGAYKPDSSEELGWLGHFAKESARLEELGMCGRNIFRKCSQQSVNRLFEDLGKCNHIKNVDFSCTDLAGIVGKMVSVIKNNTITRWDLEGCHVGVNEANLLFNAFRDLKSLEELCIIYDGDDVGYGSDDDTMAMCIPSLSACMSMRKLELCSQGLSINSCTALGAIFPRMASLYDLNLYENTIDDNCVEVLVRGLAGCKHIRVLNLRHNVIDDDGLDTLIQGLPASVGRLVLENNEITLARQLPLLRFKNLDLSRNPLSLDGQRFIAESLANPECRLERLHLDYTNIGDEGAKIIATSMRSNRRLTCLHLTGSNIAESGWNAFSSILCDTSSTNATHASNHTLQVLGVHRTIPQDITPMLQLNSDQDKSRVAAAKILRAHRHLDMRPLFDRRLDLLPRVVAWLGRFAEFRLDLKLSSIFQFVRAMPMDIVVGAAGTKKGEKCGRQHNMT